MEFVISSVFDGFTETRDSREMEEEMDAIVSSLGLLIMIVSDCLVVMKEVYRSEILSSRAFCDF